MDPEHTDEELYDDIISIQGSTDDFENHEEVLLLQTQEQEQEMNLNLNENVPSQLQRLSLHPLRMNEIVQKILDYLDIEHLMICRLVCKMWRLEGGKLILRKHYLNLKQLEKLYRPGNYSSIKTEELRKFVCTTGSSAVASSSSTSTSGPITLNLVIREDYDPLIFKKLPPEILNRTRRIKYSSGWSIREPQKLPFALLNFPNVETLQTGSLNLSLNQRWLQTKDQSPKEMLAPFLSKLNSLREIWLAGDNFDTHTFGPFVRSQSQLHAMKQMTIMTVAGSPAVHVIRHYLDSGISWQIQRLSLDIGRDLETPKQLLEELCGSLRHLKLDLRQDRSPFIQPNDEVTPGPLIPNSLTNLWSIQISCYTNNYQVFKRTLIGALQLPNLKKMSLYVACSIIDKRMKKWLSQPTCSESDSESESEVKSKSETETGSGPGDTVTVCQSESLEELQLTDIYGDASYFLLALPRLWPNLKSLHVQSTPVPLPLYISLKDWIGLERLNLELRQVKKEDLGQWEKFLVGSYKPTDFSRTNSITDIGVASSSSSSSSSSPSQPQKESSSVVLLKDLKNLKHLRIQSFELVTDFLVYGSLRFMTQLQSLVLSNGQISKEALKDLTLALGPHVSIITE